MIHLVQTDTFYRYLHFLFALDGTRTIYLQGSGGALLAAGLDGGNTLLCATGAEATSPFRRVPTDICFFSWYAERMDSNPFGVPRRTPSAYQ